ncbi:unnamed protein product [Didymodactylos carnosus]|uniref:Uncharacterized protein n=1 Tax=Didymodactylos carnosus TaxID=1234261 RepID=A0A814ZKC5_9BILA|nr:unnamed protein product [Didymodactylos carnosus]CAF4009831.1 unnamed protein product [Didymodactylos carnosus]
MEEMFKRLSSTIFDALSSAIQQVTSAIMSATKAIARTYDGASTFTCAPPMPVQPPITTLNPSNKNILFDITPTTMVNKPRFHQILHQQRKYNDKQRLILNHPVQQQLTTGPVPKGEQVKTTNENICSSFYSAPRTAEIEY